MAQMIPSQILAALPMTGRIEAEKSRRSMAAAELDRIATRYERALEAVEKAQAEMGLQSVNQRLETFRSLASRCTGRIGKTQRLGGSIVYTCAGADGHLILEEDGARIRTIYHTEAKTDRGEDAPLSEILRVSEARKGARTQITTSFWIPSEARAQAVLAEIGSKNMQLTAHLAELRNLRIQVWADGAFVEIDRFRNAWEADITAYGSVSEYRRKLGELGEKKAAVVGRLSFLEKLALAAGRSISIDEVDFETLETESGELRKQELEITAALRRFANTVTAIREYGTEYMKAWVARFREHTSSVIAGPLDFVVSELVEGRIPKLEAIPTLESKEE